MTEATTKPAARTVAEMVVVVWEHALAYRDNGRGWDILIDMVNDKALSTADIEDIIGTTRSDYQAKNRVYRWLQPILADRKAEDAYEAHKLAA